MALLDSSVEQSAPPESPSRLHPLVTQANSGKTHRWAPSGSGGVVTVSHLSHLILSPDKCLCSFSSWPINLWALSGMGPSGRGFIC